MGRIKLVGLEVEGGWDGEKGRNPFYPDGELIADRSIDGVTLKSDKPLSCTHVGEAVSKPLLRPDIQQWILKYWPQYSNNTCGFHIHTSTNSLRDYCALTAKSFLGVLVPALIDKGKKLALPNNHYLFHRLSGSNPFSLYNFDASNQIRLRSKSIGNRVRYGVLNYAWGIHGTMEFRGFPTFETPELAFIFTETYLDVIENYLEKLASKQQTVYTAVAKAQNGNIRYSIKTDQEKK